VQADRQNYEALEGPDHKVISAQEERTWSVLSHLSMFLNLFTGFLGPVAALIIWLVYKDRSRKAVDVVPDRVARNPGRGLDGDGAPDHDPDRVLAHPGDGCNVGCALRARSLRCLQGKPGRGLPLPHSG
jgi:hypothetical protein